MEGECTEERGNGDRTKETFRLEMCLKNVHFPSFHCVCPVPCPL